jgi:hypothetical protein
LGGKRGGGDRDKRDHAGSVAHGFPPLWMLNSRSRRIAHIPGSTCFRLQHPGRRPEEEAKSQWSGASLTQELGSGVSG